MNIIEINRKRIRSLTLLIVGLALFTAVKVEGGGAMNRGKHRRLGGAISRGKHSRRLAIGSMKSDYGRYDA